MGFPEVEKELFVFLFEFEIDGEGLRNRLFEAIQRD